MHWPIYLKMKRGKPLKSEMLIFTRSRVAMKSLPPKGMGSKLLRIIQNVCYFNA